MKTFIQLTTVLFLFVQTMSYGQTKSKESISTEQDTVLIKEPAKTKIDAKKFIGKYLLEEGDLTLEIIEENNEMYIVSPFSKDILVVINETTLHEPTRGVDLELIKDDKNALKFSQNGYVTTIKRIDSKDKK